MAGKYRKSRRSKRKYAKRSSRAKKYNRGRSRRRKNPLGSGCMGALRVLVDHAQETYPHFESPRGQADIRRALAVLKRRRSRNPEKRWTLADIKAANHAAGNHFFDRATMKFFNDRASNFGVRHEGGKIIVYRKKNTYQTLGNGTRFIAGQGGAEYEFDPKTGRIKSL